MLDFLSESQITEVSLDIIFDIYVQNWIMH